MNFPNLPGAKLHVDSGADVEAIDDAAAEVDRRLAALSEHEVVPVRAEWLEATVARAGAARRSRQRSGPVRRLLAAALAVFGLHGALAATTVATIGAGVVVASLLWTAERNSNETMPYSMALQILQRSDQPEEHRITAMSQVVARIRATITVLSGVRDDPRSPPELSEASRAVLDGLRTGERVAGPSGDPGFDPLTQIADLLAESSSPAERLAVLRRCAAAAEVGMVVLASAPSPSDRFEQGRATLQRRLSRLLAR